MQGRVLVVDDDDGVSGVLGTLLEDAGYEVRAAEDGRIALEIMEHWQPQVILLDLMMPIMDGCQFRDAQRQNPLWAAIPVIAMSAGARLNEHRVHLAPHDEIAKPFDFDALISKINRLIEVIPHLAG